MQLFDVSHHVGFQTVVFLFSTPVILTASSTGPKSVSSHPSYIPLTSITTLRGAEHFARASTSSIVTGQNIVCAKFRSSPSSSHDMTIQTRSSPNPCTSPLPITLSSHSQPSTPSYPIHAKTSSHPAPKSVSSSVPSSPTDTTYSDRLKLKKKLSKSQWDDHGIAISDQEQISD